MIITPVNVNDAPTSIQLSNDMIAENSIAGTAIGTLSATDVDGPGGVVFSLVNDRDGRFAISGNQLIVGSNPDLDFETQPLHNVAIRVEDGAGGAFTQVVAVNITNVFGTFAGTSGNDFLVGSIEEDTLTGFAGNDVLLGLDGPDVMIGGEGDDTYLISSQYIVIEDNGSSTGDVVKSTSSFKLTGGLDDLFLLGATATAGYGNAGDNMLHGSRAINTLYGLDGADILSGGRGRDLLVGGAGADEFRFHKGFGVDTINDFTSGEDLIVSNLVGGVRDFERLDIRQRGPDTIIDFGHGDRLILEAFDGKNLSIGDFSTN